MASVKVESLTPPMILGEGPHWDQEAAVLYFVDLHGSTLNKYDPATGKHTSTKKFDERCVGFSIPIQGQENKFAVGVGRDLAIITWNGENGGPQNIETILTIETDPDQSGNRFNDAKADPNGRLWAGSMGAMIKPGEFERECGSLYSISKERNVVTHVTKVGISNGLAWSKDLKHFFYIDSHITKVFKFDYDAATGSISNRRSLFDFETHGISGFPDGMTIDSADNLWVACFSGGQVICINSKSGHLIRRVNIPAPNVTSLAFGGPELDELYVTTASKNMTQEQLKKYPSAGALFKVTGLGVKGMPGTAVQL
ncbi:regucalcin-like [Periplaneta americana]|uniref:regucalcin-like n=1 Tax=Periplaneta americana TaxID=6978 RepID=UPI0037E9977F